VQGPPPGVVWKDAAGTIVPNVLSVNFLELGGGGGRSLGTGIQPDLFYIADDLVWRVDVESGVVEPAVGVFNRTIATVQQKYESTDCSGDAWVVLQTNAFLIPPRFTFVLSDSPTIYARARSAATQSLLACSERYSAMGGCSERPDCQLYPSQNTFIGFRLAGATPATPIVLPPPFTGPLAPEAP
jgi:hypothetical protein